MLLQQSWCGASMAVSIILQQLSMSVDLTMWEEVANRACFATDQQQKTNAESTFHLLTKSPQPQLLFNLVSYGSDTLLFVLFSYIGKNAPQLSQSMVFFEGVTQLVGRWPLAGYSFQRDGNHVMAGHAARTIMHALGKVMKELYAKEDLRDQLVQWVRHSDGNYFKLWLLRTFVDAIEVVDTEMGYITYRTMVYSFQDHIMPLMCDIMLPYFEAMEEGVKMSELSQMQAQLNVNEGPGPQENGRLEIPHQLEMEVDYVMMLLSKIMEFNYNITYTEYESETVIESCLISFPERVNQKLLNFEFLNAIFFLIDKVGEIKEGDTQKKYLQRGLSILTKMMQARMSYVAEQVKDKYMLHAVRGLTHLINKCREYNDPVLVTQLIICNKKLFINTELALLKRIISRDPVYANSQLYEIYIQDLCKLLTDVVSIGPVNIDNTMLAQALELSNKLLVSFGTPSADTENPEAPFWSGLVKGIIFAFINKLTEGLYVISSAIKLNCVNEVKTQLTAFFEDFKKIGSHDYMQLFTCLHNALTHASQHSNLIGFSNLMMLMCELIERHYLERHPDIGGAKDNEMEYIGQVVKTYMENCKLYSLNRQALAESYPNDQDYIELGIILFCEAISFEFLTDYDTSGPFQIKKKLFLMLMRANNVLQDSIHSCFYSKKLITYNLEVMLNMVGHKDLTIELHVLDCVERCIHKLKWNMKRDIFIDSQFFTFFSEKYSAQALRNLTLSLRIRTRVAKIITTLTFDDILDEYKSRINEYINSLHGQDPLIIVYELLGIFEGLDSSSVCRYFFRKLHQTINLPEVMTQAVIQATQIHKDEVYRDICQFCKGAIMSKGLKINNNPTNYDVARWVLPIMGNMLDLMIAQPNLDLWAEPLQELVECLVGIMNCSHLGIFTFDANTQGMPFRVVLTKAMNVLLQALPSIKQYPKLQDFFLEFVSSTNKEILEFVYYLPENELPSLYQRLLISVHELTIEYVEEFHLRNKQNEDKMLKAFECVRTYFAFHNTKRLLLHKTVLLGHLDAFVQLIDRHYTRDHYPIEFVSTILTTLLDHGHAIVIRAVGKLFFEIKRFYPGYMAECFRRAGMMGEMKGAQSVLAVGNEDTFLMEWRDWVNSVR